MGHYISVEDIKPHYMKVLFFKNSQFWPVLIKIRETWVRVIINIAKRKLISIKILYFCCF